MTVKQFIVAVLLSLLAAIALYKLVEPGGADAAVYQPQEIEVRATALPRDQQFRTSSGDLNVRFAGGWVLSSEGDAFGGFSGLVVDTDSKGLIAINDKGDWWQAPFDPSGTNPPQGGTVAPYAPGAKADKTDLDAESLVRARGGFLVAFEQRHRLEWVARPGALPEPAGFLAPIDFAGISDNSGMEAIVMLSPERLLAFSERGLNQDGVLKAWLVDGEAVKPISFRPPKNFAPTDAALLPDGDVLLLLRHYSAVDGVAVRVHRIKAADLVPGAVLVGEEVLELKTDQSVDNMEGLDLITLGDNIVRLVMISDDNFNPLQRTLLMMFDYRYK